jgi:hypothetical protein
LDKTDRQTDKSAKRRERERRKLENGRQFIRIPNTLNGGTQNYREARTNTFE